MNSVLGGKEPPGLGDDACPRENPCRRRDCLECSDSACHLSAGAYRGDSSSLGDSEDTVYGARVIARFRGSDVDGTRPLKNGPDLGDSLRIVAWWGPIGLVATIS